MPTSDRPPDDLQPDDRPDAPPDPGPDETPDATLHAAPDMNDVAAEFDAAARITPDDTAPSDPDVSDDSPYDDASHDDITYDDAVDADAVYDDSYDPPEAVADHAADDVVDGAKADVSVPPGDEPARPAPVERPPVWVRWWMRRHWVIYIGAFVTPLIVLGALVTLLGMLDGEDGSSTSSEAPLPTHTNAAIAGTPPPATLDPRMTPDWPANIAFAAHTVPARIRNTFSTPGERHGYEFDGSAGDMWQIAVAPYQGSGTVPVLALYGPDGARICQNADCSQGAARAELAIVLETSGTYRLVISSASSISTGYYLLTLDD